MPGKNDGIREVGGGKAGKREYAPFEKRACLQEGASLWSKLYWDWISPVVLAGEKDENLRFEELGGMRKEDDLKQKIRRVEAILEERPSVDLDLAMLEVFRREYFFCFLVTSLQIAVYVARPALMTLLIRYYENKEETDARKGFLLVCLFIFVQWLEYLAREHNYYESGKLVWSQQHLIEGLIKNKSMRMSAAAARNFDGGKVNNVKTRSMPLAETYFDAQAFFRNPIMLAYFLYKLFSCLGWSFFGGGAVMLFLMIFDRYFNKTKQSMESRMNIMRDQRHNMT